MEQEHFSRDFQFLHQHPNLPDIPEILKKSFFKFYPKIVVSTYKKLLFGMNSTDKSKMDLNTNGTKEFLGLSLNICHIFDYFSKFQHFQL